MLALDKTHNITYRQGMPRWLSAVVLKTSDLGHSVRRRWRLYRMQWLDDHLLHDIGVTREELEWALRMPLSVNAAFALRDRAKRSRSAEAAVYDRC